MIIGGIILQEEAPSIVSDVQLYCWIKYSVGKPVGGEYRYGAVKPPEADCAWFPAAVSAVSSRSSRLAALPLAVVTSLVTLSRSVSSSASGAFTIAAFAAAPVEIGV